MRLLRDLFSTDPFNAFTARLVVILVSGAVCLGVAVVTELA